MSSISALFSDGPPSENTPAAFGAPAEFTFDTLDGERELGEAPLILRQEMDRRRREDIGLGLVEDIPIQAVEAVVKAYIEHSDPPPPQGRRLPRIMIALAIFSALCVAGYLAGWLLY